MEMIVVTVLGNYVNVDNRDNEKNIYSSSSV